MDYTVIFQFLRSSAGDDNKRKASFHVILNGKKSMFHLSFNPVPADGGTQFFSSAKGRFKLVFFLW